jgi:hypothetical protein
MEYYNFIVSKAKLLYVKFLKKKGIKMLEK